MSLEVWYGECHPKSASVDASFVKNNFVGAENGGVYNSGLVVPVMGGRVGWFRAMRLVSSHHAPSSTARVSCAIIDRLFSE